MAFSLTAITGGAQTGFTSPTYTPVLDTNPPDVNAKMYVISAVGGTQAGVTAHSIASPFTITFWRPKFLKVLRAVAGQLTLLGKVESNVFNVVTRKGVTPFAGQPVQLMIVETKITIPAGADTADAANVKAALSAHFGAVNQTSAGIGDTALSGVV